MPAMKEAFHLAKSGRPGPVLVDITKDAQQAKMEFAWDAAPVQMRGYRPATGVGKSELLKAVELIKASRKPVILAGQGILQSGAMREVRAFAELDRRAGGDDAARARRLPGQPSAQHRHDGHARRGVGESCHSGGRPAARLRHALRRSRDRQPQDLRRQREEDPHRHRPVGDQQERLRRRGHLRRPARGAQGSARRRRQARPRAVAEVHRLDEGHGGGARHPDAARQRPPLRAARDQRHLAHHRRQRDHRDRRRPAPDVGGAVLQARGAAHAHHLGRPRHDGLRPAGGDRRQDGAARRRGVGDRRRRRLPDDPGRADDRGAGRRQGQRRHHQQRLPRHGAAVAGVLLRSPLRRHAAAQPGLREAGRGARPARACASRSAPTCSRRWSGRGRTRARW